MQQKRDMSQTPNQLSPPEAWEIIQSDENAVLLDVRSSMEYEYVGHPANSINLPWMEAPEWKVNTNFAQQVKSILSQKNQANAIEELPILLICRSGKRSDAAAKELLTNGYKRVFNILEGFEGDRDGEKHRNTVNGWRFRNLPWEQS